MSDGFDFLAEQRAAAHRGSFFVDALLNPAFHWFFTQGQDAILQELYLPGVLSLLNGIEASIRVTLRQLEPDYRDRLELSSYQLLSPALLRKAHERGLPVAALALPGENFEEALRDRSIGVVRLRNDICHGNVLAFVQELENTGHQILTPECLRPIAAVLLGLSYSWAADLAHFRSLNGRRPPDLPIPEVPPNPLAEYLPRPGQELQ